MYLKLKLDAGIYVIFRVRNYNCNPANADDNWCTIDLVVKKQDVLNYRLFNDEALETYDVRRISEIIEKALNGEDLEKYEPMEPYMYFDFTPETKLEPLKMNWRIYIWSGVRHNSESTISLCLYEEEMQILLHYLRFIAGNEHKEDVKEFLEQGIFVEDNGEAWTDKTKWKLSE
jgi:hypothetical protein